MKELIDRLEEATAKTMTLRDAQKVLGRVRAKEQRAGIQSPERPWDHVVIGEPSKWSGSGWAPWEIEAHRFAVQAILDAFKKKGVTFDGVMHRSGYWTLTPLFDGSKGRMQRLGSYA